MEASVLDTSVTGNEIETWLRQHYGFPVKIVSCRGEKIGDGHGFVSTLVRIIVKYKEETSALLPQSFVFKTISWTSVKNLLHTMGADTEEPSEETVNGFKPFHEYECCFYRVFGENNENVPIPIPKIYKMTENEPGRTGVILMEDMGKDSHTVGPTETLSLDQLYQVAEALASLHAWCWKNDQWTQKVRPVDDFRKEFGAYASMMMGCFRRLKSQYPDAFDKIDVNEAGRYFQAEQLNGHNVLPQVIVHGDFYSPNFIFGPPNGPNGGSKLIAVVDWALSHQGCALEDIAALMARSTDSALRREHTMDILKHYYDNLVEHAGADHVKAQFSDIVKEYNNHFLFSALFFIMQLDWLLRLYIKENEEAGDQRKALFDRCVGVYEDFVPLWLERRPTINGDNGGETGADQGL